MLGQGIFNTDGALWQHSRDMLRPNFTRSQVGDLAIYERHVKDLISALPRDGTTVNLAEFFFSLTMDSATELLFGESTSSLVPDKAVAGAAEFGAAFNAAQNGAINRARFPIFYKYFPDKQYERDVATVHRFLDRLVEGAFARHAARKTGAADTKSGRYIFADELINRNPNRDWIRGELLNILLAGRDTTASLLSNVWFEMAKRPDIFANLKAEIDALLPGGLAGRSPPTYEQLKNAKYLRAVLNESLRLYPLVPGNAREAQADTTLPRGGGADGQSPFFVAKGDIIGWSLYTMHRRKDLFGEDAEEFRPERWLGEKGLRPSWEYLPFNGGPRICLGRA